jgi:hypothetical protein
LIRNDVLVVKRAPPGAPDTNEGLAARAAQATRRLEIPSLSWDLIRERLPCAATRTWEAALLALQADATTAIE